jgi:hypothetical protein
MPKSKKMSLAEANGEAGANQRRIEAVLDAAERQGLLGERTARVGVRVSPVLLRQAKKLTGIETDSELIAFALANVALEDDFAKVFKASRGTVPRDIKLGF